MIVKLGKRCRIVATDSRQFELQELVERTNKDTGEMKPTWSQRGYFGTLEQAANAALRKGFLARGKEARGTQELIVELHRVAKQIAIACEGAVGATQSAMLQGVVGSGDDIEGLFAPEKE